MRVAAVELFVHVKASRAASAPDDAEAEAVARALRAGAAERRSEAVDAIRRAAALGADVILCPGWTFVGRAPTPRALSAATGGARVVFEVLADDDGVSRKPPRAKGGAPGKTWRSWVHERGAARELAPQVIARAAELDEDRAVALAEALRTGRAVGEATVIACGEINAVRRRPGGGTVRHEWDPRVAAAGVPASAFAGRLVLNPAHVPFGSYLRAKAKEGPWRAIVCTANMLDRSRLGRAGNAPPAHAAVDGRAIEPAAGEELASGSRVLVFDV